MCIPLTLSSQDRQSILLYFFQCPGIQSKPVPDGKHFPLRSPFGSLLHAQDSLLSWDMQDSPLASLQQQPDSGAQIPQLLKALQCCSFPLWVLSSRAGKDKPSLKEFLGIPAPVCGIMGSRDRKAGSLQVSGYSWYTRKTQEVSGMNLFNSSPLHRPSGTPRNFKINSKPYFNMNNFSYFIHFNRNIFSYFPVIKPDNFPIGILI